MMSFIKIWIAMALIPLISCNGTGKVKESAVKEGIMKSEEKANSKIVYVSHLEDDLEIFIMNVDGSNTIQLTDNTSDDMYPSWSHDGSKIAFLSDRSGVLGVYVMNADGSEQRLIKANSFAIPSWSNDNQKLLIMEDTEEGSQIKTIDLRSLKETAINSGSSSDGFGKWAANSKTIVFESGRDGNSEIYRVNVVDGSNLIRLTEDPGLDEWPSWSKDGKYIAYASGVEGDKNLWIMDADGSKKQKITEGYIIGDSFPSWSPDGKFILFTTFTDDVAPEIFSINIQQKKITKIANGSGPDSSPF